VLSSGNVGANANANAAAGAIAEPIGTNNPFLNGGVSHNVGGGTNYQSGSPNILGEKPKGIPTTYPGQSSGVGFPGSHGSTGANAGAIANANAGAGASGVGGGFGPIKGSPIIGSGGSSGALGYVAMVPPSSVTLF